MNNCSHSELLVIRRALRQYSRVINCEIDIENKLLKQDNFKNNKIFKLSHSRNLNEKKKLEIIIKKVNSLKAGDSQ